MLALLFTDKKRNILRMLITSFLLLLMNLNSISQKIIVIDAGHGGKDPGAIQNKIKEKDITLKIALKVGNYLTKNVKNIKVVQTRTKDVFVELNKRAEIANKNKADLFVSIHVNAHKDKKIQGTSTYVMGLHKSQENLEVAVYENSSILYENNYKNTYNNFDPNSPESYIIFNLYQNENLETSIKFAEKVQWQFKNKSKRIDKGVRQAGFLVLWQTTMPSVLIEVGFLSNTEEAKFINSEYGQDLIASAIYRAIKEFIDYL